MDIHYCNYVEYKLGSHQISIIDTFWLINITFNQHLKSSGMWHHSWGKLKLIIIRFH
jgi:hypothetical protein